MKRNALIYTNNLVGIKLDFIQILDIKSLIMQYEGYVYYRRLFSVQSSVLNIETIHVTFSFVFTNTCHIPVKKS